MHRARQWDLPSAETLVVSQSGYIEVPNDTTYQEKYIYIGGCIVVTITAPGKQVGIKSGPRVMHAFRVEFKAILQDLALSNVA